MPKKSQINEYSDPIVIVDMVVVFTCRVVGMISFALDASKVVRFVQLARKKLMDGTN